MNVALALAGNSCSLKSGHGKFPPTTGLGKLYQMPFCKVKRESQSWSSRPLDEVLKVIYLHKSITDDGTEPETI